VVWGIEDCRQLSLRLERDLLDAGQRVVRVPPQLIARTRASSRTRGKSDPIDALAVARAVLREPNLPVASHDEVSRELKLMVDRREDLVSHRTSVINRLLWRVHELEPSSAPKPGSLHRAKTQEALRSWLATQPGLVAELAREELADIIALTAQMKVLERRIGARVQVAAPSLLTVFGCGELTAAKVVGETAGVSRFRSEAAFARYAGVAPVPPAREGVGVVAAAQHRHLFDPQRPGAQRYPLDRAHQRVQPDGGFDRAQSRRAGSDKVVACQREFEPAGQAQPVYSAHHRQRVSSNARSVATGSKSGTPLPVSNSAMSAPAEKCRSPLLSSTARAFSDDARCRPAINGCISSGPSRLWGSCVMVITASGPLIS
jgi:transposase